MRISGDQLGTQGFMHEMSYWISIIDFGVMHDQIYRFPRYLLAHLTVPEIFGV